CDECPAPYDVELCLNQQMLRRNLCQCLLRQCQRLGISSALCERHRDPIQQSGAYCAACQFQGLAAISFGFLPPPTASEHVTSRGAQSTHDIIAIAKFCAAAPINQDSIEDFYSLGSPALVDKQYTLFHQNVGSSFEIASEVILAGSFHYVPLHKFRSLGCDS